MSEKRLLYPGQLTQAEFDAIARVVECGRVSLHPYNAGLLVAYVRAADDALREIEGLESAACPLSERAAGIARAHRLAAGRGEL